MATESRNPRRMWLIVWVGLTLAPLIYYYAGSMMTPDAIDPAQIARFHARARVFAALQLLLGAFLFTRARRASLGPSGFARLLGGEGLATPADFQTRFIIASALVEACAIWGFVLRAMGAPIQDYVPFGGATFGVFLLLGLPTGLSYWRARKMADQGGSSAIE